MLDLSRLNNAQLLQICDCTKLTAEEFEAVVIGKDSKIITVLNKLIIHPTLSLEDLKSIEIEKFSDQIQQHLLGSMLTRGLSTDLICVILDKMRSVNYGGLRSSKHRTTINPLIHCCSFKKFDLVKLLVEKYNADIEHLSYHKTTAIMYSASVDDVLITKYLYDLGARLNTPFQHVKECASKQIKTLIKQWETDKKIQEAVTKLVNVDQIRADHEKLKLENNEMKRNYQTILNLLQNDNS